MGAEAATSIAMRILHSFEEPISDGKSQHQIGSGIGIALIPSDATTLREGSEESGHRPLSGQIRAPLRFAVLRGRNGPACQERAQLDRDLRAAIAADRIRPFFQPVVDLKTGIASLASKRLLAGLTPALGEIPP